MPRLTFLSHFILCLACAAAAFFAWRGGVFTAVWANDASMMTSVIGALFIGTVIWLGRQAWLADGAGAVSPVSGRVWDRKRERWGATADAEFGHLAERLLPMLGLFGTAFGLSLQAKALSGGATSFAALATSLYTTAAGVLTCLIVAVMTYSLECGIRRVSRASR